MVDERAHDDSREARWEPPRAAPQLPPQPVRRAAGLRLDVGWLIVIRGVVAALYLFAVVWPDRPLVLVATTFVATACALLSVPAFRLPLRLRIASRAEAITIGAIAPIAAVQAYLGWPGSQRALASSSLVVETTVALVVAMVGLVLVVERHREQWSPTARSLVLWPGLVTPAAVFLSTPEATTPFLARSLGTCFLAAAVVTSVARLAPVRVADWVTMAGTLSFLGLVATSGQVGALVEQSPVVAVFSAIPAGVGLGLSVPAVRDRMLGVFEVVVMHRRSRRPIGGDRLTQETDRDRGDLVPLL
ncbi:MAG: hypothetical protein N2Z82_05290 [Thermomicrobium sp.]|nr:hypothetical protein [Thermomicrobium sp.]